MGCCGPEYRKAVNEKEEKINEKGKESLPFFIKILGATIVAGAIVAFLLVK
ncbi:hypothetical protein [Siminovitchia acidinfaciens]|uniref:hypothetical protein n=1 Tax=Siminovitchia acidinfaciens TaxID=2321395 RepID=UPI0013E0571E|nr:hypothetical protein [Siminovitchia acidinfaciens]